MKHYSLFRAGKLVTLSCDIFQTGPNLVSVYLKIYEQPEKWRNVGTINTAFYDGDRYYLKSSNSPEFNLRDKKLFLRGDQEYMDYASFTDYYYNTPIEYIIDSLFGMINALNYVDTPLAVIQSSNGGGLPSYPF